MYYSLSDQLYGTFDHGDELRQILAGHMVDNKKYFMQFVVAEGGERRRPKRAAVSAYATRSADVQAPSEEDKERRFEDMVAATRKNGEWGSSEHLQAFCQAFKVDINVYTMDGVQAFRDVNASPEEHREVIHVAFHVSFNFAENKLTLANRTQDFKHYSSVRPLDRSHAGLFTRSKSAERHYREELKRAFKEPISVESKDKVLGTRITRDINESKDTTTHSHTSSNFTDDYLPKDTKLDGQSNLKDTGLAVDVFPPWDIQSIQDGLGGRYDRATIIDMLQKCRGDIDRAFAALLGENQDIGGSQDMHPEKKIVPGPSFKSSVQVSRESSPFSTGSKRSAEDSDDSEDPRPAVRRGRPKRRIVSNLTLGVGISFRDDQNEVVSLNLRMKEDAEKAEKAKTDSSAEDAASDFSEPPTKKGPRRSGRLSKPRVAQI